MAIATNVEMVTKPSEETLEPAPPGVWRRLLSNPLAAGSLALLAIIAAIALLAPVIAPYGYAAQDLTHPLQDATDGWIIWRHILPNLLSPILVAVTVDAAGVILAEASLSFLGIGVQRPFPSWGRMINDALDYYRSKPQTLLLTSILLSVTVL